MSSYKVVNAEALETLKKLPDSSITAVVTDPPYELNFMGNKNGWDNTGIAYSVPFWAEVLRVLKPGGHLLSFGGTRTYHRMACAIEDAGFEIRDSIDWVYSGFPKSFDISKGLAKSENTKESEQWAGYGTALKPSHEPIVVARKPFKGTLVPNVLEHGTGALNIDGCRVGSEKRYNPPAGNKPGGASYNMSVVGMPQDVEGREVSGRWPANILLSDEAAIELDHQSGFSKSSGVINRWVDGAKPFGNAAGHPYESVAGVRDEGGASRYFPVFKYQAKAPKKEKPVLEIDGRRIAHSTVKPVALMQWLVKLVMPPHDIGGVLLDPFAGSGTTVEAAYIEGYDVIGIERESDYVLLIEERMKKHA